MPSHALSPSPPFYAGAVPPGIRSRRGRGQREQPWDGWCPLRIRETLVRANPLPQSWSRRGGGRT